MPSNALKILLVDDDSELVGMLCEYLALEGFSASTASCGSEALEAIDRDTFSLVVLDVMMPGADGYTVLRQLRQKNPSIPVIMLTARGDASDRILGLEMGADDYVPKPCPPRELVARIRAILRRSRTATADVDCGILSVQPALRKVLVCGEPVNTTSTEFSILQILAQNAGTPVSKEDISQAALGRKFSHFDRTIDVHVSALRRKITPVAHERIRIESIRGVGYQLIIEDSPW